MSVKPIVGVVDTFAEIWKVIGICAVCGELDSPPSAEDQRLMLKTHNDWIAFNPEGCDGFIKMARAIMLCDGCYRKSEHDRLEVRKQAQLMRARRESILPQFGAVCRFADSDPRLEEQNPKAWTRLREWKRETNLWIFGTPGTGKTYGALAMMNHAIESLGWRCACLTGPDLGAMAQRFDFGEKSRVYADAAILLLDDIDKGIVDRRSLNGLWSLIDRRHQSRHRTLITANVAPETMRDIWRPLCQDNPSMLGTLFERLLPAEKILFEGTSYRREGWIPPPQQTEMDNG